MASPHVSVHKAPAHPRPLHLFIIALKYPPVRAFCPVLTQMQFYINNRFEHDKHKQQRCRRAKHHCQKTARNNRHVHHDHPRVWRPHQPSKVRPRVLALYKVVCVITRISQEKTDKECIEGY